MLNASQTQIQCESVNLNHRGNLAMRNFHAITFLMCHMSPLILFLPPILLYKRPLKHD